MVGSRNRKVLVGVGALALAGMLLAGVVGDALAADSKIDAAKLPKSIHGAVETKAFTAGTVLPPLVPKVGSILFDPGPAYAYATLDRDDYGEGNVNYTMTARGANLDPGFIAAGGVFWPAPDCTGPDSHNVPCITSGGSLDKGKDPGTGVDTGLETAKGWPMYAEALYPDQPGQPSNQTAYKCIFNKDVNGASPSKGQFSSACQQGGDSVPFTAWATAVGDNVTSEGFSRGAGVAAPGVFSLGSSESHSFVQPGNDGVLHTSGYATIHSIDIGGGQIKIDEVRSSADIKANSDKVVSEDGDCTMSGLTIGGQPVKLTGGEFDPRAVQPLLDGVKTATQLEVDITPPTGVQKTTVEGAKRVVSCSGLHITITDLRTSTGICSPSAPPPPPDGSGLSPVPQCVPPAGVRYELSFGTITAQESVNAFAGPPDSGGGGGAATSVLGNDVSANPSVPAEGPTADLGAGAPTSLSQTPFSPPRSVGRVGNGTQNVRNAAGIKYVTENLAAIAALTGGAAAALGLCVWFLLGVVDSVAKGTPLKLPGL